VSLLKQDEPQSFGSSRPSSWSPGTPAAPARDGKVASGGELSRIALAIAVTTSQLGEAAR
jgi:DNA repair protein RecN (Recombination protein N)